MHRLLGGFHRSVLCSQTQTRWLFNIDVSIFKRDASNAKEVIYTAPYLLLFIFKHNGSPFGNKCQSFNGEYIIPFSLLYFIVWNLSPAPA